MRVVVIGAGVVGLAVSRALSRRGCEVTCLEAAVPMAARSAGSTHLFRIAHVDPELARLAARSEWWWREWDAEFTSLFVRRRVEKANLFRQELHLIRGHALVLTGPARPFWELSVPMAPSVDDSDLRPPIVPASSGYSYRFPKHPDLEMTDRRAGVIDGTATGRYLRSVVGSNIRTERVTRLEPATDTVTVWTDTGRHDADHVVIAAGEGTHDLAAQVGIDTPSGLAHQVRFTFALRYREDRPMSWVDHSQSWRPGVLFDQHMSGDFDRWAITVRFLDGLPWEMTKEEAIARSIEAARAYIRENLRGVGREPVETVHGSVIPGPPDDVSHRRNGPVTAIWGNNLFMHAPAIADQVATDIHHDTGRPVRTAR